MSWATKTVASVVQSSQTMNTTDIAFTFNANTERAYFMATTAAVTMSIDSATSGKAQFIFPVSVLVELRLPDLAGATVQFNGGNTAVMAIIEQLRHS